MGTFLQNPPSAVGGGAAPAVTKPFIPASQFELTEGAPAFIKRANLGKVWQLGPTGYGGVTGIIPPTPTVASKLTMYWVGETLGGTDTLTAWDIMFGRLRGGDGSGSGAEAYLFSHYIQKTTGDDLVIKSELFASVVTSLTDPSYIHLYRNGSLGNDNFNGNVYLLGLKVEPAA